uniref:Fibronectin type-III domain-containing protein n=1 Tax=Chrysemys picta bellii TaxID=8478 RepID=A0A8C3ITN6_CHRPI
VAYPLHNPEKSSVCKHKPQICEIRFLTQFTSNSWKITVFKTCILFTGKLKEDQNSVSNKSNSKKASLKSNRLEPPAQASHQVLEQFPHPPPLPRIPPYPELKDGFRDTVPPQKPELKLAQVQNPKGIALSWTVTEIDPKCAPVESYHLFIYHEHSNNSTVPHWKKIGEIKALPLPMACSLSQFTASKKYYFTIQSKDVCGRYGPFCDIQSITLISLENS